MSIVGEGLKVEALMMWDSLGLFPSLYADGVSIQLFLNQLFSIQLP